MYWFDSEIILCWKWLKTQVLFVADCLATFPLLADPRELIGTVGRKCERLLHRHGDVLPSGVRGACGVRTKNRRYV